MVKLKVKDVNKIYVHGDKQIEVLKNINIKIKGRQAMAIVGPSGCGKTTLARIICGLEKPTSGEVLVDGKKLEEPSEQIMMVFSKLNLLPWKTVEENIELGIWHLPETQRKRKVREYIDLVGLEGFEDFYPKDLSTGMAIRAELARALVREPDILILDDVFGGLDPLTANNLRNEVLRFYWSRRRKPHILIIITNNIEEAVFMADLVLVMSQRPGTIKKEVDIELERPRNIRSKTFYKYVDKITAIITE
jgi:ABC-type nitrate/sulfonate/bicarbonate transport system ATPase subunit